MTDMDEDVQELADRILEKCNEATRAENSGSPEEAGELFGEASELTGEAVQLLEEAEAEESRVEKWRTFQEETRRGSENLLEDGESDVNMDTVFDIPELSPDLAVTARNTEETPERRTFEASKKPSGEVELSEQPSWAPNVSVAGLGETGRKTVEMIETGSSAQVYSSPGPEDVGDSDYLFVSADLSEPDVLGQVSEVLGAAGNACTVLFAEGRAEDPEEFVDDVNLLFPVAVKEGDPRQFLSSMIADLFEAMLRPTVRELGKGDIRAVAGENRVGNVFIDNWEDTSQLGDLTPWNEIGSIDALLLFFCYDGPYPMASVDEKMEEYERPDDAAYLWDPRTHSRYQERAHIKRIEASETSQEEMAEILTGGK